MAGACEDVNIEIRADFMSNQELGRDIYLARDSSQATRQSKISRRTVFAMHFSIPFTNQACTVFLLPVAVVEFAAVAAAAVVAVVAARAVDYKKVSSDQTACS